MTQLYDGFLSAYEELNDLWKEVRRPGGLLPVTKSLQASLLLKLVFDGPLRGPWGGENHLSDPEETADFFRRFKFKPPSLSLKGGCVARRTTRVLQ